MAEYLGPLFFVHIKPHLPTVEMTQELLYAGSLAVSSACTYAAYKLSASEFFLYPKENPLPIALISTKMISSGAVPALHAFLKLAEYFTTYTRYEESFSEAKPLLSTITNASLVGMYLCGTFASIENFISIRYPIDQRNASWKLLGQILVTASFLIPLILLGLLQPPFWVVAIFIAFLLGLSMIFFIQTDCILNGIEVTCLEAIQDHVNIHREEMKNWFVILMSFIHPILLMTFALVYLCVFWTLPNVDELFFFPGIAVIELYGISLKIKKLCSKHESIGEKILKIQPWLWRRF